MKGIDTMTTYIGYAVIGQNLRPTASTSGSAIAWIPQGAELTISLVDGENAWLTAVYEGEAGYVSARNVGITNAGTTCQVTGSSAKVYRTPSTSATQLYTTATGDILQLLDSTSTEGWYRVSTADGTGWAQASMLTIITSSEEEDNNEEPDDNGNAVIDFSNISFQQGDLHDDVWTYVQDKLLDYRYTIGDEPTSYGLKTVWSVKYFQHRNGLTVDGVAGPQTLAKLHGQSGEVTLGVDVAPLDRQPGYLPETKFTMNSPLWKDEPFDAENTTTLETIGNSANGPSAVAMAFSTIMRAAVTPPVMCDYALKKGYRDPDGVNGVDNDFYTRVCAEWDMRYLKLDSAASDVDRIKALCTGDGLAIVRLTYNTTYPYCSTNGATYVVVYKVDDSYVYLVNANGNSSSAPIPLDVWRTASWVKEAYLYSESVITE